MIKRIIITMLSLLMCTTVAHAQCDISVKDSVVTLKASGFQGDNEVLIRVFRSTATPSDLLNAENMMDVIAYQAQAETDGNGNATFTFYLDKSDTYTVEVGELGATATESYTFEYTDVNYSKELIEKINTAIENKNAEAVKTYVNDNYEKVSLGATLYEAVIDDKTMVQDVFEMISNGSKFEKVSDLEGTLNTATLILQLQEGDSAAAIELISQNSQITAFGENNAYAAFDKYLSESNQKAVITEFLKNEYKSCDEALERFANLTITSGIKNSLSAATVKGILTLCEEDLGISLSKCESLNNPSNVYLALSGQTFSTLKDVAEGYETAYENQKDTESSGGSSSGGSGGGGGGGGSSSVVTPIVYPSSTPSVSTQSPATQTQPPQETGIFDDLADYEWAKESIESLYEAGVVSGRGERLFAPDGYVTREEFAKLITLAAGIYNPDAGCDFADVRSDSWYYSYVASGVENGILMGMDENTFGTGNNITREDMAAIIYRVLGDVTYDSQVNIPDAAEISDYARESVSVMYSIGILSGMEDGSFCPKKSATRAEAAVIIDRMINFQRKE